MRLLGIPCLRDKIVQEAMRMALEPIFEVEFPDNSYGFRLKHGIGQKGKLVPKIKISQKSISSIRLRLNEVTRYRPIDTRVQNASAVIRGWSNYFKIAHNFSAVARKLNDTAHWAMVKAISRKNDISSKKVHGKFYFNSISTVALEYPRIEPSFGFQIRKCFSIFETL